LTLDCLTFDLTSVTKHVLTYTALSKVHSKKKLYLLSLLLNNFVQVDHLVQEKMFRLRTNAQYKLDIVVLKFYCSNFLIVKSFNVHSLTLHFEDVLTNPNLLASHILCFNETRIRNVHLNSKIYNALSQKFQILSCEPDTMVFYDDNVSLIEITTITNYGVKFITALFNDNTREALYIIAMYKPPKM
jgi:hypothetical protein